MQLRYWITLATALSTACGSAPGNPAQSDPDAGTAIGVADAGSSGADGGGPDGESDAGIGTDAGSTADGGARDGGTTADAGTSCPLPARDGGTTNPNWIGGPCESDSDCSYTGGICLRDGEGYPNGLCTMPCTSTCPDRFGTDDTTTFCVAGTGRLAGGGMCVSRCDFTKEPLGCRRGYHCVPASRPSDLTYLRTACLVGPVACYRAASNACLDYRAANNPLDRPDTCPSELCDVRDAMYISSPISGITYRNGAGNVTDLFVSCELALALEQLGPILADMGVVEVTHYGTYNCRQIAGTNCVLSQHGLGLAIDIASFKLRDGGVVSILSDWEPAQSIAIEPRRDNPCRFDYTPTTAKGEWLYQLVYRMCDERVWSIILSPNYNSAHDNHLHVDLTEGYTRPFLGAPSPSSILRPNPGNE